MIGPHLVARMESLKEENGGVSIAPEQETRGRASGRFSFRAPLGN